MVILPISQERLAKIHFYELLFGLRTGQWRYHAIRKDLKTGQRLGDIITSVSLLMYAPLPGGGGGDILKAGLGVWVCVTRMGKMAVMAVE